MQANNENMWKNFILTDSNTVLCIQSVLELNVKRVPGENTGHIRSCKNKKKLPISESLFTL